MSIGTRRIRPHSPITTIPATLVALVLACGGGGKEGKPVPGGEKPLPAKQEAKTDPKADPSVDTKIDAKADGGEAKADGGEAKADGGDAKADGGDAKADGGEAKADGGDAKADGGDATAADPTAPPADPATLEAEIKQKKTTDERAIAALAELEASGTKLRDVAKAANARGEKLFEHPDRAKTFFEWAAAKDPKYPDPVFNLAKQTATAGDVDATRDYLTQVKARGGKKLLSQIDFDPMWEIVKDDPDVRKLLEG